MAACCVAFAQADLTTREAAERRQPDFTPSHLGRTVRVRGRVCTRPVHILELYIQVGIEQHSYGLVLETPRSDARMDTLAPGDDVEASGTIRMRGGLPVLAVSDMRVLGRSSPPAPVPLSIDRRTPGVPQPWAPGCDGGPHRRNRGEHRRRLYADRRHR
jgi:hypothetical protein